MKTLVLLIALLSVSSLHSPRPILLGFAQLSDLLQSPEDLYSQAQLCPHSAQREVDGKGHSWPRYCRVDRDGQETEVLFKREYVPAGWTYAVDQFKGRPEMQFRLVEHISPCAGKPEEQDGQGKIWPLWCNSDGNKVEFLRIQQNGQEWTYEQDKVGGVGLCQYRKIRHDEEKTGNPQFLETKWGFLWNIFGLEGKDEDENEENQEETAHIPEPIAAIPSPVAKTLDLPSLEADFQSNLQQKAPSDCYPLETDPSERYFWVQFDSKGHQIAFEKDSRGNYLLSNTTHTRIPVSHAADYLDSSLNRNIALSCPVFSPFGREINLQPDESIAGMYWKDDGRVYEPSLTQDQQAYGMYEIDPSTGRRIPVTLP